MTLRFEFLGGPKDGDWCSWSDYPRSEVLFPVRFLLEELVLSTKGLPVPTPRSAAWLVHVYELVCGPGGLRWYAYRGQNTR